MNLSDEPCKKKARKEVHNKQNGSKNKVEKQVEEKPKSQRRQSPKFRLKPTGHIASLGTPFNERVPIVLTDVQHLLLHSLLGNLNITQSPRWYTIDRCNNICQTTCLIIEGVSIDQLQQNAEKFININTIFDSFIEILTPSAYNGSLVKELALVPLSETEKECIIQKYGSLNLALEVRKDLMVMMRAVFPIEDEVDQEVKIEYEDKFPRTQLLLSAWQLIEENYPVPLKGKLKNIYSDYVFSKEEYKAVTPKSPMFGLDCEMCVTNMGSELTRVSVVNEKYEVIYEALVKPYNKITDYLTRYSGITQSTLANVTKRLEDVQKELREVLPPDAILVGQSLNSDLNALKMFHPYVIDTSLIYNFAGERTRKPKLKILAKEFLNLEIQTNSISGHCSVEDSIAALKLVQLKLSKSIEFGDAVHTNRQNYKENIIRMATKSDYALSIFNHIIEQKKTSLVVGCDDITGDYHTYLTQAKDSLSTQLKKGKPKKVKLSTVDTADEVISTATEAANDYNFVMAHLKGNSTQPETDYLKKIDEWVNNIWNSLKESSLFVAVFSGTTSENGVAMIRVKNIKC